MSITLRPAKMDDLRSVAARMRPEDAAECRAGSGMEPQTALVLGSLLSLGGAYAAHDDHGPIAIFGLVPGSDPDVGHPWLLGTPELAQHPRTFVRLGREWFRDWHREFLVLTNVVDARNTAHLRWLRACGAQFIATLSEYGHERRPFVLFEA